MMTDTVLTKEEALTLEYESNLESYSMLKTLIANSNWNPEYDYQLKKLIQRQKVINTELEKIWSRGKL